MAMETRGYVISLEADVRLLGNIELFSEFNDEQLRLLAFGSQKVEFPKGTHVFHDGQTTDGGYAICSGAVELVYASNGSEQSLGRFKSGDLIGEMAILTKNKRVGSAIVLEDCELIKVSRSTMRRVLEEYPELAAKLYQKIAASVSAFSMSLELIENRMR